MEADKTKEQLINELAEVRQENSELEGKYRFLYEGSPAINMIIGTDGVIKDINDTLIGKYGFTKDDIIGKHILKFIISNQRKKVAAQLRRGFKGEFTSEIEVDIYAKDRSIHTILFSAGNAILKEKGQLVGILITGIDITERKKIEKELIHLSNALKASSDSIVISDLEGKITDVNEATLEIYGTDDKRDLVGKSSFDIFIPEDREKAFAGMKEVMEKGYIKDQEYHIVIKDGSKIPVEMSTSIMKGSDGEPIGLVAVTRDITERKKSEQALCESEEKYRTLVDSAPIFIGVHQNGKWVMVSKTTMELLGYKKEDELLGKPALEILHPDFRGFAAKRIQKMEKTGKPAPLAEEQVLKRDGGVMNVLISSIPIFYKGEPAFQVTAVDITDRKKAEESLRESEEQYRGIFESAGDTFLIFNPEGEIIEANPAACKMYGYPHEELIGLSGKDIVHPDYYHLFEDFKKQVKSASLFYAESVDVRKDGSTFNIEVHGAPYNYRGKPHLLAVVRGITERKRAEKELLESEERYKELWENAPVAYHTLDTKGIITRVNQTEAKMLGCIPEEMVGKSIFEFILPEQQAEARKRFRRKLSGEHISKAEDRIYVKKDGTKVYVAIDDVLERDSDGKVLGVRSTMIDITERKQAEKKLETLYTESQDARKSLLSILADVTEKEQALRESEEKYREIFDNISEGIYRATPDGKMILANPALVKMLGYDSAEELLKVNAQDGYKSPGDSQKFVELINKNGRVYGFESKWKKKDGTILSIRENASIVRDENGNALYYDGTVEDITERKIAEQASKLAEDELKERVNELERFQHVTIGRELKMIELKNRIKELEEQLKSKKTNG